MQAPLPTPERDPSALRTLCLASLGGDGVTMEPAWAMAIDTHFGSVERWREAFTALGKAADGGSGWVLLSFHPREGALLNHRITDVTQAPADTTPLLALDLRPRGHDLDRGDASGPPIDAFMATIDWAGVHARYQAAVRAATEPLSATPDETRGRLLLDVRRAGAYAQASQVIEGARWRDPAQVAQWAPQLPAGSAVLVYCVHGHEISRAIALRLNAVGIDARFLRGGIEAWKAAGLPLADKPTH